MAEFNKDFFKQFANEMEGLEKGEIDTLCDIDTVHINYVRFLTSETGEYAQFCVDEVEGKFFNSSNPVYNILANIRDAGQMPYINKIGWRFKKGVSKQWNAPYIAMTAVSYSD